MASIPPSYETDWERLNAKSWELPNYGPGPDYGRGTIYVPDEEDEYPGRALGSNEANVAGVVDYAPAEARHHNLPPTPAGPATGHYISIPESRRPHVRGTGAMNTYAQDRPRHPSTRNTQSSQNPRRKRGSATALLHSPSNRGTSDFLQHGTGSSIVPIGQNDIPSKAKWRNGSRPDGKCTTHKNLESLTDSMLAAFRLPYECRVFQKKLSEEVSGETHIDFRQQILEDTGAYLRISDRNAKLVHIWGGKNEVWAARAQLQEMANSLFQLGAPSNGPSWSKIRAYSNTKAANSQSLEFYETRLSGLRQPPKISAFYTLAFLWPMDGPTVDHCLTARREILDSIRLKYDVNIYAKPGAPDYLFISGNSQRVIGIIASRLRELWQSLFMQCDTEMKLFLVGPPPPELMRTHVILQKCGQFTRAVLCGPELAPDVAAKWKATADRLKLSNKNAVTGRLKNALHILPEFQGFLQMRVKFGTFALQQWRRPEDGASYRFSEFREMVSHRNAEGRLLPGIQLQQEELFERITASQILKPWGQDKFDSLTKLQPKYTAEFDYKASRDTMIRVEVRLSLPRASEEFEVNGIRCFKPQPINAPVDRQMPMQISMIDFERSDWQFEVKALELCPDSDITPELQKFMRSIAFQWNPTAKSITSVPQRKAKFIRGARVTRFVEKAALYMQVKGTPYVFELARFDEYNYVAGHWSLTANVSWGASLYDPMWDDLLGEKAKPGILRIPSDKALSVFFPSPEKEQRQSDNKQTEEEAREEAETRDREEEMQLTTFMSIVQQIARMLKDPGAEAPDVLDSDLGTLF
ncbi:uncharacterized protein N7515_005045 [Penicillium bovifimosum]|uniref:DUF7905 domain-containing protein n=1 Tax=Penicillium bovifimosum TaxID=126998 RepID=A0A9W9L4H9_9EURO|nr:uncharacterized protein N7515_005045 [Penicillium bovifimosum]KAJ5135767.1 hypothetical protein N7515_005045 [Penicillium bovifimosum]